MVSFFVDYVDFYNQKTWLLKNQKNEKFYFVFCNKIFVKKKLKIQYILYENFHWRQM